MFDWTDLITALGLLLVLEGVVCALFSRKILGMMRMAIEMPAQTIRNIGIGAIFVGVVIVWFIRG